MQNEKSVEKWTNMLLNYTEPGIKSNFGFCVFKYETGYDPFNKSDSIPFVHILGIDGDIVKKSITKIIGINLNLLDLNTRVAYIESLKKISYGAFGKPRKFGEVYINELQLIHPAIKTAVRTYNYSKMTNILFIKNDNIEYITKNSIGKI